ncbi:MAG: VOC family protein [Chloroflexi bacterium]|nr:VOC family protein [Chloroflexota bacterium]
MAKLRHIAIRAEDTEATARFLVETLGLTLVQRREHGPIDLSDGDVNITILPLHLNAAGVEVRPGVEHIGFTVEDEPATRERLLAHGAQELRPVLLGQAYYESKFQTPEGLIIDVGHWVGTSPLPAAARSEA